LPRFEVVCCDQVAEWRQALALALSGPERR
jgi:hypothetical protein